MACMKDGFMEGLLLDDGRFEALAPLNHGSFGMVFLAKDTLTDEQVAIKCLGKTADNEASLASANDHLLELTCHNTLGYHPNIVNLLHAFETDAHMYLVLEFCSMGDLYEAIRVGRGPLETEHVRDFMFQLVDAVQFMHSKGIYHRDIKPENIFLAQDGSMKLGDFGLSTTETWTYEAAVGSDRYMAPEQYDPADNGYCPAQADIWAVGICLLNILFSRNPFVTPTESDPLFNDFVRDKQSLFDIFPTMSQDTFEVLVHALSIEPKKRCLSSMRDALERVISFTTDDEVFDDYCTEDRDVVPASANRQPLRTPSIASPPIEQGGAFPWAKALHMSPPQTARQLSAIPDTELYHEDMFPASEQATAAWYPVTADAASLASVLDSTLGASIKSMNLREPKPKNTAYSDITPTASSLPIAVAKPVPTMSSIFGIKDALVSKSWSDMWEEDEENDAEVEDPRLHFSGLNWSSETVDEDVTLRQPAFTEANSLPVDDGVKSLLTNPSLTTLETYDERSSDEIGSYEAVPEPTYQLPTQSPTYSPPMKRAFMDKLEDKWAALGNRRRAVKPETEQEQKIETPRKQRSNVGRGLWRRGFGSGFGMKTSSSINESTSRNRLSGGSRTGNGFGAFTWDRRSKDISNVGVKFQNWRRDQSGSPHQHSTPQYGFQVLEKNVHEAEKVHEGEDGMKEEDKDIGDLEWVGGWEDLHL